MFLHSYANVAHEQRMVEILREALPDGVHHRVARRLARTARIRTHVDGRRQRLRRTAREHAISNGSNAGSKATASTATC